MAAGCYLAAMKPLLLDLPSLPVPNFEGAPPAEAISTHAKELWAAKGCPSNQNTAIWFKSEHELLALQRQNHCNIGLSIHG